MGENSFYPVFVPATGNLLFFMFFCLPRRLRRYALSGLPLNSYAVITKTLSGSGSGTYITRTSRPALVCPVANREPS